MTWQAWICWGLLALTGVVQQSTLGKIGETLDHQRQRMTILEAQLASHQQAAEALLTRVQPRASVERLAETGPIYTYLAITDPSCQRYERLEAAPQVGADRLVWHTATTTLLGRPALPTVQWSAGHVMLEGQWSAGHVTAEGRVGSQAR